MHTAAIQTWRALDTSITGHPELLLKIYSTRVFEGHYGFAPTTICLPQLDELMAHSHSPGVAPFLGYQVLPLEHLLVCRRRCYPLRFIDCFPPGSAHASVDPALWLALFDLAAGIDSLQPAGIALNNLLMDGSRAFLADWSPALQSLTSAIEAESAPLLVTAKSTWNWNVLFGGAVGVQFALAALYYELRTNSTVFGPLDWRDRSGLNKGFLALSDYKVTGKVWVDNLPDSRERSVIANALRKESLFPSCTAFVQELHG